MKILYYVTEIMSKNCLVKISRFVLIILFLTSIFYKGYSQEIKESGHKVEVILFYSITCPHCEKEIEFLKKIEDNYPNVRFIKYPIGREETERIKKEICKIHEIENYCIYVPITIVRTVGKERGDYFIGFESEDTTGKKIINAIENHLKEKDGKTKEIVYPIIGDVSKYSLPILSIILGFLDGFNICSLSALVIILSLVIGIKSRKVVLLLGGVYIITTSFVYGLLMFFWYNFFEFLGKYTGAMELLIGFIGIFGAVYFFREFWRFRKYGPSCDAKYGKRFISKFIEKFSNIQEKRFGIVLLALSILSFSFIITIVEFPCSAGIPLFYTGILANKQLDFWYEIFLMILYLLFYMLDEILVFLIAVFTLKIKLTSSKATTFAYLFASIILFVWGMSYIVKWITIFI